VLYQRLAYYNMQWYAGSPQKASGSPASVGSTGGRRRRGGVILQGATGGRRRGATSGKTANPVGTDQGDAICEGRGLFRRDRGLTRSIVSVLDSGLVRRATPRAAS
jgi:hypothetical protein